VHYILLVEIYLMVFLGGHIFTFYIPRELINAELITAVEGTKKSYFAELIFADRPFFQKFAELIFAAD